MFGVRRGLLLIILIAAASSFIGSETFRNLATGFFKDQVSAVLTDQAQKHILYGNAKGGGHKYGVGKPCKSEFPKNWDDAKITSTVEKIASNDNLNWKRGDNGYYVADDTIENVKVRVVLNGNKRAVVTAYPLNGKRNPCTGKANEAKIPAPANDNFND